MAFKRPEPGPAIELLVERRGLEFQVQGAFPVRKSELPFAITEEEARQVPFFFELQGAEGVVFRGTGYDPTSVTVEFPGGGTRERVSLIRAESEDQVSYFTLLVPDIPEATGLRIYSAEMERRFGTEKHSRVRSETTDINRERK